jgi:hypothetical protein
MPALRLAVVVVIATATGAAGCDPASWDEFRSQLAERACERAIACGDVASGERGLCSAPGDVLALLGRDDFDIRAALAAGHLEFVPTGATRCLDAIASAPCEEGAASERLLLGCNNVVRPATAVGNACWADRQCEGGRCDRPSVGCPGRCAGWLPLGAACVDGDPDRACDPTVHYCGTTAPADAGTGEQPTCLRKKQRGEKCASDVECSFGLVCTGETCGDLPRPKEGDACAASTLCDHEVYCAPSGICVKQQEIGQPCDAPLACRRGLACVGLKLATATTPALAGVCGAWLATGAACDPTASVSGCPRSHTCSTETQTCVPSWGSVTLLGYGEGCIAGDLTRRCGPGLSCIHATCVDTGGRGAECASRDQCRQDFGLDCIAGACASRFACQ